MKLAECLALDLKLPKGLLERFYAKDETFAEAWQRCEEPRVLLLLTIEAMRLSHQDNGRITPGEVFRLILDLFPAVNDVTAGYVSPAEEARLQRFLDTCREACDRNTERTGNPSQRYDEIFKSGPDAFVFDRAGKLPAATLVPLLEKLHDVACVLSRGRFCRLANSSNTWATLLKDLRRCAHLIDLHARSAWDDGGNDLDARLATMVGVIRGEQGFVASEVQAQLRRSYVDFRPSQHLCMLLLPTSAHPAIQLSHGTLRDPMTKAVLCRVREQGRLELVDATLTVTSTPIEAVGEWTLYHVITDRPVELHRHLRNHDRPMADTDQDTGTFPSVPVWP